MPRFQLIARQPLAVAIEQSDAHPRPLYPDCDLPVIAARTIHTEPAAMVAYGGTLIGIDFETEDDDLVRATGTGLRTIEGYLAALSLVSGVPFGSNSPIQIVRTDVAPPIPFLRFLPFEGLAWPTPLPESMLNDASRFLLHWRDLPRGHRLERAATRYRLALGSTEPMEGFQHAYAGLETLEILLAGELGSPAGYETVTGNCDTCGAAYEVKRSVLVGVRGFVRGGLHGEESAVRNSEWKLLSTLRRDLVHSLVDVDELNRRARELLVVVCHYLHDASAHLSHLHELETDTFTLSSFGKWLVIKGEVNLQTAPRLMDFRLLLEADQMTWIEHEHHGLVPEYGLTNTSGGSLTGAPFILAGGFEEASEESLEAIQGEVS